MKTKLSDEYLDNVTGGFYIEESEQICPHCKDKFSIKTLQDKMNYESHVATCPGILSLENEPGIK